MLIADYLAFPHVLAFLNVLAGLYLLLAGLEELTSRGGRIFSALFWAVLGVAVLWNAFRGWGGM